MAKAEKTKLSVRVDEVLKLLTVGATLPDIKRYADQHGWGVGARQVQRYVRRAHKRFAKLALRDRQQLLGRHLAQRNALYTKAVKDGDLRTALLTLKDEAKLQGLYPGPPKPETDAERLRRVLGPDVKTDLSRATRVARLLTARANNDTNGEKLVKQSTPKMFYALPDTTLPEQMLHILAMAYVAEQLEYAGMVTNALLMLHLDNPDLELLTKILAVYPYRYKIGREGWELFCQQIEVDPQYLVSENYSGMLLKMIGDNVAGLAAPPEEIIEAMFEDDDQDRELTTVEDVAKGWRRMFEKVTREGE